MPDKSLPMAETISSGIRWRLYSSLIVHNLAGGLVSLTIQALQKFIAEPGWTCGQPTAGRTRRGCLPSSHCWFLSVRNGQLSYLPNASGDVIPNFSTVGYETGDVPLLDTTGGVQVPVIETINPSSGDQTTIIQNAINAVEAMPLQSNGFRGAVLLTAGNYQISGTINITASGVVLEGQGNNQDTGRFQPRSHWNYPTASHQHQRQRR